MNGKACVYAIRHEPTGKVYVGCTSDVERRVDEHMKQLVSGTHTVEMMQNDFDEYGGNYSYFILFEAYASYDAFAMEKNFMSLLGTRNPEVGYNYKDNSNEFSLKDFKKHKIRLKDVKKLEKHRKNKIPKNYIKSTTPTSPTKVKEYRLKAGLTQSELSKKSGISRYTIIKLERNEMPSVRLITLKKIAEACNVQFTDLLDA